MRNILINNLDKSECKVKANKLKLVFSQKYSFAFIFQLRMKEDCFAAVFVTDSTEVLELMLETARNQRLLVCIKILIS